MLQKIKDFFKKKTVEPVQSAELIINEPVKIDETVKKNLFYCHHCGTGFEVTAKMQFPTQANKIGGGFVQAIGVTCTYCQKDCIYG